MEVVGYPNYLIYPDGRIVSKRRKGSNERILKNSDNGKGYHTVTLYKDGTSKRFQVHRLVALHYIPNPDNKPCVDHINRVTTDNRVENLRWVTYIENSQNMSISKCNTSGHKNIYIYNNGYKYTKTIRGITHSKWLKTLEEAIEYKKEYEKKFNL
jgi:hypothetical protein